jgi:hypothetical protein
MIKSRIRREEAVAGRGGQTQLNRVKPVVWLEMARPHPSLSPRRGCRGGRAGSAGGVGWDGQSDSVRLSQTGSNLFAKAWGDGGICAIYYG